MNRSDVFVSYRRANKEFAIQLDQALKQAGLEVWIDWEDIPPGAPDFTEEIRVGIEGADTFIAVLSAAYLESAYCMGELDLALQYNKRVVPIILDDFDRKRLPDNIRSINWVYFTPHLGEENTFEDAFPQLMEAITADREYITEHTRLLLRAQEWLNADRNHSLLLHGKEVNEAEAWLTSASDKDPKPLALHSEYIFASRARQRSLQRRLLFGVSIAMALSLALAAVAIVASFNATRSNATATSLLLSIRVENALAENDIRTALSLAMEANNLRFIRDDAPNFSKQTLASIAYDPGVRRVINVSDTSIWAIERQPNAGTLVASGTANGTLSMWDLDSPDEPLWEQPNLFNGSIWDTAFHPDGSQIASAGTGETIYIFDATTSAELNQFTLPGAESIWSVSYDPSGQYIAAGGTSGDVYVLSAETGDVLQTLSTENDQIWAVAFSPQGLTLTAGGSNGVLQTWVGTDFQPNMSVQAHTSDLWSIAFKPNGEQFATAGSDGLIKTWNIAQGFQISDYIGHTDRVLSITYSANGRRLLSGAADGEILVWQADDATQRVRPTYRLSSNEGLIWDIALTTNRNFFLSATTNGVVLLWDIREGQIVQDSNLPSRYGNITTALFGADSTRYVYGTTSRYLVQQQTDGGGTLEFPLSHTGVLQDIALSPDGTTMLSAGDSRAILWDVRFGGEIRQFVGEHPSGVRAVAYAPDASRIYTGGNDNRLLIWDTETATLLRIYDGHSDNIRDIVVRASSDEIITASDDRSIRGWYSGRPSDSDSPQTFNIELHDDAVTTLALSPDEQYLVSGSEDNTVRLHQFTDGNITTVEPFIGHEARVTSVGFSPDGKFIVSADESGTVIVWDQNGNRIRVYNASRDSIVHVQFDQTDGSRIISVDSGGNIVFQQFDSPDALITWVESNRHFRDITCDDLRNTDLEDVYCNTPQQTLQTINRSLPTSSQSGTP